MKPLTLAALAALVCLIPACSDGEEPSPAPVRDATDGTPSASAQDPLTMEEAYGRPANEPAASAPRGRASTFPTPEGWVAEEPANAMRVAQYVLPRAEGDGEDGAVVITRFPGDAGGLEENIKRWEGQFVRPDDAPPVARETFEVGGRTITMIDVSGRFRGGMPGSAATADQEGHRMLGAIVTDPKSWFFVKATGPERTIGRWKEAFVAFLKEAFAGER